MTDAERATGTAVAPDVPRAAPLPSVSVVIPTRDRPELLRHAIAGIVGQTYEGLIEVVVVFDQSEPDTSLETTSPNRVVRTIANTHTPGLAGGRNTGMLAATGELLAFCDDDDEWLPPKLDAQVRLLSSVDGPAIAACGIEVRRNGQSVTRIPDADRLRYEDFLDDRIMEVNPCTILVDRELAIHHIGLVDEELPGSYAEDYEWLLRATKVARILLVPEAHTVINWGTGSFFAERWRMIHDAIEHLLAKHPDLRSSDRGLARLRGQQAFALAAAGERRQALRVARETWGLDRSEKRTILAVLVALRLLPASLVVRVANRLGRGV